VPKGGLARRASAIQSTRTTSANVLLLDAGNALWNRRSPGDPAISKLMIEAMNLMGYDAMTIGDLDLQLGPEVLRERMAEASFPFLSANVTLAGSGELLAPPYVLRRFGAREVGIIGLTWDFGQQVPAGIGEQYILLEAEDVLARNVSELEEQTDIVIVLSNMGYEEDQHLSSLVPGIDLIVSSRSRVPVPSGWRNEQTGTIVVEAGSQGIYLGRRHLHFDAGGQVTEYSEELVVLTPDYAGDPEMLELLGGDRNGGC